MFSEKQIEGFRTGKYTCDKCEWPMIFENEEMRDVLVCTNPACGYSCGIDDYGKEEWEIEMDYPTEEEARRIMGEITDEKEDEDYYGETYDEVYNELDNE